MNRIYKVVFNKTLGAYTAVSELASFKGKKSVKAAVAVSLAGLMMAGAVSAAGLSGGKDGTPENPPDTKAYTGTVDGLSGAYAASNGAVTADGVTVGKNLYGGYDYAASGTESRAMASNSNTVTVTNRSDLGRKNVRGGTVSAASDVTVTSVTASGNGITVEEDSVANGGVFLVARVNIEKEVTGTLTVDGNTVDVTGKSAAYTKFYTVEGAEVYSYRIGGDVSVSGNKANVSQATISRAFEGAFLAVTSTTSEDVNLKADKNEAGLTDVVLAGGVEVYGADIVFSGVAKDVSLSENKVTLDNVTSTRGSVFGGHVSLSNGVKGTLDANRNAVSVTGKSVDDTAFTQIHGAALSASSAGGDVSVSGNKVTVSKATVGDDSLKTVTAAEISVETTTSDGVNLKADGNEVSLTDAKLGSNVKTVTAVDIKKFGTVNNVSLSENKVTLNNIAFDEGTVYGVSTKPLATINGTIDANKNAVSVTGKSTTETVLRNVYAADVRASDVKGNVTVGGNTVTVTKAKIDPDNSDDQFAGASLKLGVASGSNVAVTANGNTFILKDAESADADIYGVNLKKLSGQVTGVSFSENKVTLDNSKAAGGNIYGASVDAASATASGSFDLKKNEVTVTGISKTDTVLENAYGVSAGVKMASGSITASENKVSLTDAKLSGDGDGYAVAAKVSVSATGDGEVNVISEKNVLTAKRSDSTSDFTGAYVGLTGDEKINRVTIDGNTATVENGELWGNVTGADFYIGENSGDKVTVGSAEVKNNKATVKGVTATNIVGADVKGDNVTLSGNAADVSGNSDVDFVAGASAVGDGATLTDNKATVTDSTVKDGDDGVYGAEVNGNNATVSGNSATVSNSQVLSHTVDGNEIGGYVQGAEVSGNNAKISGNSAKMTGNSGADRVYGAYAEGDNAEMTNNTADVAGSAVKKNIIGGAVIGDKASVSGNTAIVSAGTTTDVVEGAYVKGRYAEAKNNQADVSDSNIRTAHGARITDVNASHDLDNAVADNNTANVTRSSVVFSVAGVYLANAYGGKATNNTANVTDSSVTNVYGAEFGGVSYGSNVATGNTAKAVNSEVDGQVAGVLSYKGGSNFSENTATVIDSKVRTVEGVDLVYGDGSELTNNTANVEGDSVIEKGVWGANATIVDNVVLTKNTVNLSGNTEFKDGAVVFAAAGESNTDDSTNTVSDNTVNVTDSVKLSNVDMYGRRKDNKGSGNTLNLNNWKGKDIKSVNYFDTVNIKTSSAAREQVVIGDLVKGNADTQVNIGLDSKAARELEDQVGQYTGDDNVAAAASKVLKIEKVDGSDTHNELLHVSVDEGDVIGKVEADVYENATVRYKEQENSVMKSLTNIAANNFLVFRSQMNDMDKRMGDLRTMPQSDGVWGRAVAGQAEYKQMHSTYKTLQVGADKRIGQFLVGATASYTDADGSLKNGSSDDKNYTYGIYGSWLGDNGHYVDVIVKRHHVQSDYDLRYTDGRKTDGMMHTSGTSISAEYGKRFAITNTNFYVEPQVEVMWGHLDSDSYKLSNGVQIKQDGIDSLIGRLGVAAGWVSPDKKGSAYIKASVLNDWEAESDVTARKGNIKRRYTEDMGGTWGEFAIGGTYNFGKNFSAYGEVETTAGNPTRTTYQASAGIRYSF